MKIECTSKDGTHIVTSRNQSVGKQVVCVSSIGEDRTTTSVYLDRKGIVDLVLHLIDELDRVVL